MALDNVVFNTGVDAFDDNDNDETAKQVVHLRIQQRNGRKCLTLIQGLPSDLDLKKILKALKKTYSTNGTILADKDDEEAEIIQLQGDMRAKVRDFFVKFKVCDKDEIKVHGF